MFSFFKVKRGNQKTEYVSVWLLVFKLECSILKWLLVCEAIEQEKLE